MMLDTVSFVGENESNSSTKSQKTGWKILVVDDEFQAHTATAFGLRSVKVMDQPIELLHAYSGADAIQFFQKHNDIAVAIIDMVMESPNSGIELVQYIRKVLGNQKTRLVLRTDQPGHFPGIEAVSDYDIDDYQEKKNLTAQTLLTIIHGRLRAYHDLCTISAQHKTLNHVLGATANDHSTQSISELAASVLGQLKTLLDVQNPELYCLIKPNNTNQNRRVKDSYTHENLRDAVIYNSAAPKHHTSKRVLHRMRDVLETRSNMHFDDAFVVFNGGRDVTHDNILYVHHGKQLGYAGKQLLELYTQSVAITFENINLHNNLQDANKELVYLLGEAVEARSKETGAHVKRVAICSGKLAAIVGLPPATVNLITLASPLHDIGKVAIPDSILHKPEKLEPHEWEIMKRHAEYGRDILLKSKNQVTQMGARIAYTHHERWDGTGYPQGLKGENIPIEGRITALVDVFDALGSRRSYKEAWDEEQIKATLLQEKGRHFDPDLVDLFLDNLSTFQAVRKEFPDGIAS
ncbi:MAG: hypothetical protein ACD_23C00751G0002 [uncultured bacterium]|nr:MAG: hypothetical protein ACD_23C00751G0002 [uncultured bacterium]